MQRFIRVLLAAATVVVVGCGGGTDTTEPEPARLDGTYNLQTVNHSPLPFITYQEGTQKDEILSWVVTLNQDSTYSYVFRVRASDGGQATVNTITSSGTYTVAGSDVAMVDAVNSNNILSATVVSPVLTVVIAGPLGTFTLRFWHYV